MQEMESDRNQPEALEFELMSDEETLMTDLAHDVAKLMSRKGNGLTVREHLGRVVTDQNQKAEVIQAAHALLDRIKLVRERKAGLETIPESIRTLVAESMDFIGT